MVGILDLIESVSEKFPTYSCIVGRLLAIITSIISDPVILLLAVPRRLFCFGSLVVLDVYSILFYPITLEGLRGITDEFATIPFHLVLFKLS